MKPIASPSAIHGQRFHGLAAALAIATFFLGSLGAPAQTPPPSAAPPSAPAAPPAEAPAPKIPNDQLDSLVAPIALYPDPLLSQTLVASTYPLEVIQLQQWLAKNTNVKGKALTDAVMKETWDPSIQAMATFPEVVKQLAENIKWTADLGNAFLAQQSDVMDAVQRMRVKADGNGALKTSKEQKVQKTTVENKSVIIIEPAEPETVYVPSYNPTTVYGPSSYYPYPPMYYPPYAGGALLGFTAGVIVGGAINGGWGYGCGWGNGDVNINNNNNFVNNSNRQNINNRQNVSGGNKWQHNPQHRGGAPYSNKSVSDKYGGDRNRGPDSNRTSNADRNKPGGDRNQGPGGDRNRPSTKPSTADRNRPSNNPSSNRPSTADRSNANRPSSSNRPSGSSDRIGNQNVMKTPSSRSNSAFSSGGGNRSSAAASHSRGSSSMSRSSGGGSRGGGSRGGGRRR